MNLMNWTNPVNILFVGIHGLDEDPPLSFPPTPTTISATVSTTNASSISSSSDHLNYLHGQLELTRFTVQKVITPALVGFGVIGNLVNIAVLTRRWMKSSTNCYLTALAVYDVLYLVLAYILSLSHFDSVRTSDLFIRFKSPLVRPLTDTCSNTGVWLTLTFTVERYIGVCHPMKGKVWCNPQSAKVIIVVVCLLAALVTFPEFFEFTVSTSGEAKNETGSGLVVSQTDFGQSPGYSIGYKYLNQALFTFLPLILLSIFNALLLNAVITAARWRQGVASTDPKRDHRPTETNTTSCSSRGHQSQQRITVMLITVVVVFLVCQTPQAVQHVYATYLDMSSKMTHEKVVMMRISANVFNLLVIANCCSNFILYSCFSSKFRMTFHKLFCAPCMTRRKRANIEHLYSEAGASALPLNPAHPAVERRNGHLATVVCTELWPSDVVNGQSTAANRVSTRVVKQLASEMAYLGGAGATEGSEVTKSSEKNRRSTTEFCDRNSPPTFL